MTQSSGKAWTWLFLQMFLQEFPVQMIKFGGRDYILQSETKLRLLASLFNPGNDA